MTSKMTRAALTALIVAASTTTLTIRAAAQDDAPTQADLDRANRDSGLEKKTAPVPTPTGPVLSAAVGKSLQEAQKYMQAKNWADALVATNKAQAAATSDYEKLKVNQFLTSIKLNLKDEAGAIVAAEAAADSAAIPPGDQKDVYTNGAIMSLNAKHYDKALKYAKAMQAMNLTDARSQEIIGKALYAGGDDADARAFAQKQIDAAIAAGKTPDRDQLEMVMSIQLKTKDEDGAEKTLEQLVAYYNTPEDWQQMIDIAFASHGMRDIDVIYLGRLLFATDTAVQKGDADLIGSIAAHLAFYGDTATAAAKGGSGFTFNASRAATDKNSMPQQIAAGANQNGLYNIKLAEALYSYGMYPQAEAAARLAQSKGGVTDPSEPLMVLGMAETAQGKYADAVTTFGQVQGGGPATPRIARLWADFAKNKANPPGATASLAK